MKTAFYGVTLFYAILCIIVPVVQYKKWKEYPSIVSMLTGGLGLFTSLALKGSGYEKSWILGAAALFCIALSAWRNGGAQGKRHISHHVVRAVVSALILAGFLLI